MSQSDRATIHERRTIRSLLLASATGLGGLLLATGAYAQAVQSDTPTTGAAAGQSLATPGATPGSDQPPSTGQEIVVTGSRIARKDYTANSPIVTVDQQLFEQSSTSALEQNLNKLPQFTPAKTPTAGGDIQPTPTNTPGSATVSLRGIGSNRSLVLLDGRRATPGNATGAVDITTIPTAAIERVEIISGGASSTYGADAVAGVTNFILKKKFSGLELDGQTSISSRGDGKEYTLSGIMGTNFADDRGNISLAMSTNKREASFQRDRDWYRDLWANPTIGGSGFFIRRPGVTTSTGNPVSAAALDTIFPGANPAVRQTGQINFYTNPDGSVFSGTDFIARGGTPKFQGLGINSKITAVGTIAPNFTDGYAILPLTRYNFLARGNYEINDWIGVFGQGYYSKVRTMTVQEPGPAANGWAVNIPYGNQTYTGDATRGIPSSVNADGTTNAAYRAGGRYGLNCGPTGGCTTAQVFPVPAQLQQILLGRANPNTPFQTSILLPFNRTALTDVNTYNLTGGIQGKIPSTDWTYEAFISQGESNTFARQTGIVSLSRIRAVMTSPNFGYGFSQQGNAEFGGFGASTATCTSGLNFYSNVNVSNDCYEAIRSDLKNRSDVKQSIWETNLQGGLFNLPAGEIRAAVGLSYRKQRYRFINDTLTTQGESFQDQALGIYPSGNSAGRIGAKEAYGELLVPVLKDLPFVKEFNLELGGRYSHYSTTGDSWTYKALGDWEVTNFLRLRGGYNRAQRTPNVAELYLAPSQNFAASAFGDVCSRANTTNYSANPALNTNAARVEALCRVLIARTGDPTAANAYYAAPQPVGGGFVFPTTVGNPNLKPETADTYTAGVVLRSPFQSPWVSRLRLTVDYYNIKVKDAIGAQSPDIAQRQCFDTSFNPTLTADSPFCSGIGRNVGNGGLGNVLLTYYNNGRFKTSGIDFALDWSVPIGPGTFNLNSIINYLIEVKSAELSALPLVDYVGTFGPNQNSLNGGSYRYRTFSNFSYAYKGITVGLQWQHLPHIRDISYATNKATAITGAPAYDLFELQTNYAVTRDVTVRFGIENLFDKRPPISGVNTAANLAVGQLPGGTINSTFYDIFGRRFYVGLKAKF